MILFSLAVLVSSLSAQVGATVYSSAGTRATDIQTVVADFQKALQSPMQITWDSVPENLSSPSAFPADFFNSRGMVLSGDAPGLTGFAVSAGTGAVRFDDIVQGYSSLFTTFSAPKLLVSTGSHIYDVDLYVPGTQVKGKVSAFGAVFTNVAIPFTTSIEYFTAEGISLGKYYARVAPKGLSFLGVEFRVRVVAKVRVTFGTAAPGNAEDLANGVNIVAGDDFIFSEPVNACVGQ